MEWLKELLSKAIIKDGVIDMDALMKSINAEFPKNAVPKSDFNSLNDTKKDLEQQIKDRDKQLKDLGEKVKGNEDAEKTIKQLQEDNQKVKDDYSAKLKEIKIDAAIQEEVKETKHPKLITKAYDKAKITVSDDGTILGLKEQTAVIKEEYKDEFTPDVKGGNPYNKEKNPSGIKNPWSKEHFNLTEQGKLFKENPALATQLQASV